MADDEKILTAEQMIGVQAGPDGKIKCSRCGKRLGSINFYTYRDGSQCEMCKPCLTAHIDNFDSSTYEWILEKMDVPYIPSEWNSLRDKAFAKDPKKMNGMSVIGKYLAKMKLKQWNKYHYADSAAILAQQEAQEQAKKQAEQEEKEKYQAGLKVQLSEGKISLAEYQTLVSTETQNRDLAETRWGNSITGEKYDNSGPNNPFQESNFMSEDEIDTGIELTKEDKLYLAIKWGRLYKPNQWIAMQQLYNEFMKSFDIQGAARIDTLKKICKTSLKMDEAIDMGDVDSYQKLSRVYDSMMKSAKFTEAQNKDKTSNSIDSASAIVDFVEAHSGQIPKYECKQPQDIVDKIILDLKTYTKSLIYEDKSLAQEIEKYLQEKKIATQMKKDKKQADEKGLDYVPIEDEDIIQHKQYTQEMRQHDQQMTEESEEEEIEKRKVQHS